MRYDGPTPYADLNGVLQEFVARARDVLRNNFVGAYLQGSLAVGDFDTYSDVDFLIICQDQVPDDRLPLLQALHEHIFGLPCVWAQHLEGSYIPGGVLNKFPPPTREFLYLDHGSRKLIYSDHDDTLVVYWSLRERGITILGPSRELWWLQYQVAL